MIQQQMLVYSERSDDIAIVAYVLDLLRTKDADAAARTLTVYLDRLQQAQKPRLEKYDPTAEMARFAAR